MTLYELLRRLVFLSSMPEQERRDAMELITELERINALGTVAAQLAAQEHECVFGKYTGAGPNRCLYCDKPDPSGAIPARPSWGRY